ncbi:MAG: terminase small subunit [Pseudomonadota bacterium]|nr:terminase small subunit [Pseudomonadota bacterium]
MNTVDLYSIFITPLCVSLNIKRAPFAKEYAVDLNATQAAIRAGYAVRSAHTTGYRLLKDDEVGLAIKDHQEALAERAEVTLEEIVSALRQAMAIAQEAAEEGNKAAAANALSSAAERLAKVCGLMAPQRVEQTVTERPPPLPTVESLLVAAGITSPKH